ncbi:hypothetical protein [Mucilaginibacter sp. CSA2-8R]|uniref:hypothetical protein n=1 Tax=Mucilaginibacter sp. CSA2-8R TaxID=3141542 RepID=UPI00315DE1C0
MKAEILPSQLTYFLSEELYLLKADQDFYSQPTLRVENLTTEPPANAAPIETPAPVFKYKGSNQKNFLILTHYPNTEFISEAHLAALTSTLGRLNFMPEDTAIVNINHYPTHTWSELFDYFKPQKLMILGKAALPNGMPALPINEITETADGYRVLYTFGFDEMMGQKENTKIFWNQIKTL